MRVGIVIIALAMSSAAWAGEVDDLISRGVKLRGEGKDAEALDLFRQAYEISRGPRALAQLGLAEQALGRWVEAESHLKAALDSRDDQWVRSHRQALEGALRYVGQQLGSVEVLSNVNGAKVEVDGKGAGQLPLSQPIRVAAGTHTLTLTCEGYHPAERRFTVSPGGLARETIDLAPIKVAQAEPPKKELDLAPTTSGPSASPAVVAPVEPAEEKASILPWIAAGSAVAAVAVGAIFLGVRAGHVSKFNDAHCPGDAICEDERSAANSAQTIATIGFIGGGALAAGAAALFFMSE
jgi:hypothetical protein